MGRSMVYILYGCGEGAKLSQHPECVEVYPALAQHAVGETEDRDPGDGGVAPGGFDAEERGAVRAGHGVAPDDAITVGKQVIDRHREIGKGGVELSDASLYCLRPIEVGTARVVTNVVRSEDLWHHRSFAIVPDLANNAPSYKFLVLVLVHRSPLSIGSRSQAAAAAFAAR